MKDYKTVNQQLKILRLRGLIVPRDGSPKRFLEQENYYNVINGYKDLFLDKTYEEETYIQGAHFNELKSLFMFDRELRITFLKYILILENSFKTVLAHEFTKKYPEINSHLEFKNYIDNAPKQVLQQISILTNTIQHKVEEDGAIKHYIETHSYVPLWVLVNYLTIGNISNLYKIFKAEDKNIIARFYSQNLSRQYPLKKQVIITSDMVQSALKIINLIRNKCAHDERLYNTNFKNTKVSEVTRFYDIKKYDNSRIVACIFYFKIFLNKQHFKDFYFELMQCFNKYSKDFYCIKFDDILNVMGIDLKELEKLK